MKTIDISWRRYILPNIHNEGWKFVGIFAAITALLAAAGLARSGADRLVLLFLPRSRTRYPG